MFDLKTAVVVASNREDQFNEFVAAWAGKSDFPWDITILVQDGGGPRFKPEEGTEPWDDIVHHDWGSITKACGREGLPGWLSRRDSGIKCWGFLDAVFTQGADVVIALDDDCLPCDLAADPSWHRKKDVEYKELIEAARCEFADGHLAALYRTDRWTSTIPGFRPRGLPYGTNEYGHMDPRVRKNSLGELPVSLNMGVWSTIPDRDAVHELTNYSPEGYYHAWKPRKAIYRHTRVMSPAQYWPMCGMNIAFRREIAPLMYFPRMGEGSPFRRFDDIWCGVIAQKCLAHLGLACSVGRPIISHTKASRALDNLVKESPGIRANEEFWRAIDAIKLEATDNTPLRCMDRIGLTLEGGADVKDEELRNYLPSLGEWIRAWVGWFEDMRWGES
jgi:hypothetical protein